MSHSTYIVLGVAVYFAPEEIRKGVIDDLLEIDLSDDGVQEDWFDTNRKGDFCLVATDPMSGSSGWLLLLTENLMVSTVENDLILKTLACPADQVRKFWERLGTAAPKLRRLGKKPDWTLASFIT